MCLRGGEPCLGVLLPPLPAPSVAPPSAAGGRDSDVLGQEELLALVVRELLEHQLCLSEGGGAALQQRFRCWRI